MSVKSQTYTSIASYDDKAMSIRGHDVCDLMGKITFTQMIFLDIFGRLPSHAETVIIDACLVKAVEHGISPSSIAARMAIGCNPDSMQGAVAAGLQTVGAVMLGTVEDSARLLIQVAAADDVRAVARELVLELKASGKFVPGFGHPHFKPTDPRSVKMFELARSVGVDGRHMAASDILSEVVDEVYGKHLTKNSATATAAVLLDIDIPIEIMRGFNIIGRSAGMVAHVYEEQSRPAMRQMLAASLAAVPYRNE